jgi:hypothetical protein
VTDSLRFPGFRIVEELGSGALTSVYKAVQESLDRVVAIKVLKPTIHPTSPFAAQLEREARVLGELSHPNVGLLYDFVKQDDGRMYLILEYVDGASLAAVVTKKTRLPAEAVAAIGAEVARGLAHAHERGVVHRDIKPANLLVSKRGDVKIFDFGIARRVHSPELPDPLGSKRMADADEQLAKLEENASFGTPAYMSPEQILGEKVDARSDVFSLGVVLYQLVCGARPFDKGDENDRRAAAQRIRRDPPVPLHRRAPDVPRPLERIIMRAIEKLPVDRYPSAEVLAEHLEGFLQTKTRAPRHAIVSRALVKAGVIAGDASAQGGDLATLKPRASVRPAVRGLLVLFGLVVAGGAVVQWTGRGGAHRVTAGDQPLELAPQPAGALRVLARPWAEVWVDGQRIDVTPFARALPLSPGRHFVTFVHPNAPQEKREIDVVAGETVTLDVTMSVAAPAPPPAPAPSTAKGGSR